MDIKLGDKVKCKCFLKKTGDYIIKKSALYKQEEAFKVTKDKLIPLNDYEDVITKKIQTKDFVGFICGKACIGTKIHTTFNGEVLECSGWIHCYEICVENKNHTWGKRYVPLDKVEKLEE